MILSILPYMKGSESVNNLANALECKKIKLEGSRLKDNPNRIIINWGNSQFDIKPYPNTKFLNPPPTIANIINKRKFFQLIIEYNNSVPDKEQVSIPDWTTDAEVAKEWSENGHDIVVRQKLTGHSGEGIELITASDGDSPTPDIPRAPLYTKYIKKQDEYRVHIVDGVITDVQRKARGPGSSGSITNYQIRNYSNGFIFVRNNLEVPEKVLDESLKAFKASQLDFGAVDVIWNNHREAAFILEINTACALRSNHTLEKYTQAFKKIANQEKPTPWDPTASPEHGILESLRNHNTTWNTDTIPQPIATNPETAADSDSEEFFTNELINSEIDRMVQLVEERRTHAIPRTLDQDSLPDRNVNTNPGRLFNTTGTIRRRER